MELRESRNAALEEVAVALHIRKDFYQAEPSMTLKEIKATSTLVSRLTGMVVPKNKAIVERMHSLMNPEFIKTAF